VSITSSFRAYVFAGLAALMLLLAVPLSAHAATDTFLKFDKTTQAPGLEGESLDQAFPKAIEIQEFHWGVENPVSIGSTGAGIGKAKFQEVQIKKTPDASSAGLMMALGRGVSIPNAYIIVRKAGDGTSAKPYLQYRLNKVWVTKIETANSSGDDVPTEDVTLAVGAIQQSYLKQGATAPIVTGWDQITNQLMTDAWTGPAF
jgi:type VI secretion system secreted protein Hcp